MAALHQSEVSLRLEQLTELSVALSSDRDITHLLERILRAAKSMTHADGGTLYRTSADHASLCFSIAMNDTLKMNLGGAGGAGGEPVNISGIPLHGADGHPNMSAVAAYAAHTGKSVNIRNVHETDLFNFSGMRQFDEKYGYRSQSLLTVPMRDHEGELIGVLQLINAKDPQTGAKQPFSDTDQRFIEALASQAAIAMTNRQLIERLETLFESFVRLINIGIDEKSPHTGRHCEHVPELTMMLAEAVHATDAGPLAGFSMSERDRRELWLAGLLHDCGKITTPVHVVEKATKLQTLYDRIETIDTRFEVLKRDARIRALEGKCAALAEGRAADAAAIEARLEEKIASLDADREFLRRANIGGEFMKPEDRERVERIALPLDRPGWQRTALAECGRGSQPENPCRHAERRRT